ncbi:DUF2971 domain-containing protein [Pseudomonas syringae]|uniref:DUF2971 domain-containing protein n=1 Tax=Pseudomonas syringae TaxID=317 RepID=UPI0023F96E01|nr:DUF2971 domain-containing protein [Pseudomonas syringae]MDF7795950.1 DUF2971 domain-containing protein [Pseudomonas syringae]
MKQLFKYMSEPRDFFEKGFIRLSQPSVLNDPFEAAFCRKSLDELASNFDEPTSWDPEFGELKFSQYIDLRMHHIGVISFTESKENLLMWAHYANEHKGIVAGVAYHPQMGSIFEHLFRADSLINSAWGEKWSKFDGAPTPVFYRKGLRYRNDKFDYDYSNILAEGADRVLYEIFLQKSDEWIYEQEHRVILRLEQADRVIVPDISSIENRHIQKRIRNSSYSIVNTDTRSCTVNLLDIADGAERTAVAMELAKLSKNPKTIYLMKLSSSSINNCLIGLNSNLTKADIQGTHACSTGYLNIWKATRNMDYYSIEFEEI